MTKFIDWALQLPWLLIVGWLTTVATFYWKLNTDAKYARYRETVAYIEKREEKMRERWQRIRNSDIEIKDRADDVYAFFSQLELISLLIAKKAFDEEIVYNFWWRYFDEPLRNPDTNTWLMLERTSDPHLFEHYHALSEKWAKRIDKEQGHATAT